MQRWSSEVRTETSETRVAERLIEHGKEALAKPRVVRTYRVGGYDYTPDHKFARQARVGN